MRIHKLFAIFVIATLVAGPVLAFADSSMRCGTQVVILGDLEGDVLEKCGEPTYTQGDKWIYDDGSSEYYRVVHFGPGGEFRRTVVDIEIVKR